MNFTATTLLVSFALFVGILLAMELGRRIGKAALACNQGNSVHGTGATEAAIFGLLGLLVALTFSGAASRFEDRRHLIAEETNDIGTAYLRIDLLAADVQPRMREMFRQYLDGRITFYGSLHDAEAARITYAQGTARQQQIWNLAVVAVQQTGAAPGAALLLLPALNQMFDITTTQVVAVHNHPPIFIIVQLALLSLAGALLSGFGMAENKQRSLLHSLVFAAMLSLTLFVVLDLEYPRQGLIRVDAADAPLVELRDSMQ